MSVTALHVAEASGFSQPTVSQVLTGKGDRYSAQTRARIEAAAAKLGYRPNAAARAIRSQSSATIGLLIGTHAGRSTLPPLMLGGLQEALRDRDLNLMVLSLDDDQLADETRLPRLLREVTCDGLLIDYTHGIPDALPGVLERFHIPAIWINCDRPRNCVRPDDRQGGRAATDYLLSLGHTRIAYADYTHGPDHTHPHYSVIDRELGYRDAMQAAGLTPDVQRGDGGFNVPRPERVAFTSRWLNSPDRPTAILGYADTTVVPIYVAAASLGLDLPGDLSLMSFGDEPAPTLGMLTTMRVPAATIGREAVRLLHDQLSEPRDRPAVAVPFELEPGETAGPPANRPGSPRSPLEDAGGGGAVRVRRDVVERRDCPS